MKKPCGPICGEMCDLWLDEECLLAPKSTQEKIDQHVFHFMGDQSGVATEVTVQLVRQRFREVELAYEAVKRDSQTKRHVWCAGVNAGVLLALTEVKDDNLLLGQVTGTEKGKTNRWQKYSQFVIGKRCMNYLSRVGSVVGGLWHS